MNILFAFQFLFICLFFLTILYNIKYIIKYPFCISLVIPSTLQDFNRCFDTLKKSVCSSIKYPHEVVLVLSGISNKNMYNISLQANQLKNCTNKLIIVYRRKNYNAASNRNKGYYNSKCSIISFFDVDDVMSIYRIYIVNKMFKENKNIDVVFHPSTRNFTQLDSHNLSQVYTQYSVTNQFKRIRERCRKTFTFDNRIYKCDVSNRFFITNGWPSIKRKIMDYIKFNETLHATEDLDFISRIVRKGYNVALFKKPLGFYIKDFSCII